MVDPISLGLEAATVAEISTGASIAGGVTGAVGSIFAGITGSNQAKYQAAVAQTNAKIAEQNAAYAREVGEAQAQKSGMQTRSVMGQTVVRQAASGLVTNSGSNARVLTSEAELGKYDQSLIRSNAAKQAYGYQVEAMQATAQSQLYKSAATNTMIAGGIGAATSLLNMGGSVANKWLQGYSTGLYGGSDAAGGEAAGIGLVS